MTATTRPPFIIATQGVAEEAGNYPDSDEQQSYGRAIGRAAGLVKLGLHIERLLPGQRTSWPHAEEQEEEFVYLLAGEVAAWIDGHLYPMRAGDLAAFPSGTGICHTFINNSEQEATLMVGGERTKVGNRIVYPLHPEQRDKMQAGQWWTDAPLRPQGPHDGLPDQLRAHLAAKGGD